MRNEIRSGVLVVGHGSRREEANRDVREAARQIGERGGLHLVEAAFLEIEPPNIVQGFKRLVERGAGNVTVHPYFLSPGRHTRGDLPRAVREAAQGFPGVSYQITEPLSAHPLVIEASIERIRETKDWTSDFEKSCGPRRGKVYLVGAGPGDPGLVTLRARDLLASCDLVVYDYLVDPEVLLFSSARAERIYMGKVSGGHQTQQTQINQLLIDSAREGKRSSVSKAATRFSLGAAVRKPKLSTRQAFPLKSSRASAQPWPSRLTPEFP